MELSSPYRSCPAERLDEAHGSKAQMPWLPIKSRHIWDGQMDLFSPSDPSARKSQAWGTDSWICLGHPHWVVVDSKKKWKSKMHLSKCLYMYVYIYMTVNTLCLQVACHQLPFLYSKPNDYSFRKDWGKIRGKIASELSMASMAIVWHCRNHSMTSFHMFPLPKALRLRHHGFLDCW